MPPRRRATQVVEPQNDDAIQEVIDAQTQETADTLAGMLQDLAGVADPNSNVKIYKAVDKTGKWAWIKDLTPPIDSNGLLEDLRNEWGGGDYYFRVYANGRAAGTKKVAIAGDPNPTKSKEGSSSNNDRLIEVMLQQANGSKSDLMAMMTMMNQQQQNAQQMMQQAGQQQMQMMMTMMTTIIPVMASGKTDPIAIVQAMAALNADKPQQAPMTEMIQNMVAMKELLGDGGGSSGGDDSFLGGAAKALLPMLAKGMEGAANRNPASPMNTMIANHPDPVRSLQPSAPIAMPPMMRSNPIPPMPPVLFGTAPPASVSPAVADGGNRIVALIKDDVLYFAKRGHDPATAAGLILDVIDSADIPENEILELVVSFQSSPDWITDLASQGVDLSAHRQWAEQLLEELVKQYAEDQVADDHTEGEGGS